MLLFGNSESFGYTPCYAQGQRLMFDAPNNYNRKPYRAWLVVAVSLAIHLTLWIFRSYFDLSDTSEAIPIKSLEISLVSPTIAQPQPVMSPQPQKLVQPVTKPKQAISKPKPLLKPKAPPEHDVVTDTKSTSEVTPLKALSEPVPTALNLKALASTGVTQRAEWRNAGLQNSPAKYPERARQMDWQGRVVLKVHVLPNGSAGSVAIAESSGHELLDDSALEAVRKWKFIPAKKDGIAVDSYVNVPVNFKLKKEGE